MEQAQTKGESLRLLCVVADTFPPQRVDVAELFGAEMRRRGHRCDWLLQAREAGDGNYQTAWGGGTAWIAATRSGESRWARLQRHLLALANQWRAFGLLRGGDYQLLQIKDRFLLTPLLILAARRRRISTIFWLSFPFPEESLWLAQQGLARYPLLYRLRGWSFRLLLYRFIAPLATHLLVQSEQMQRDLAAHGVPLAKMTPLPMGVAAADLIWSRQLLTALEGVGLPQQSVAALAESTTPSPLLLRVEPVSALVHGCPAPPGRRWRLGYLGTLGRSRQPELMLRLLQRLLLQGIDVELWLVGATESAADQAWLWQQAELLGITDRLQLTGQLPRHEAWRRIAATDLCLSPFRPSPILNSTSPTKLVEYLALARPVLANDHPEQRRVLAASGGGRCVAWDIEAFTAAAAALLADPVTRLAMGQRGRAWVARHRAYPLLAARLERSYRSLLARQTGVELPQPG